MPIPEILAWIVGSICLAGVAEPLARLSRVPFAALLLVGGFGASEVLTMAGFDTGLRWHNLKDIVFFLFLPPIVFATASRLNVQRLSAVGVCVSFLSVPGAIASASLVGLIIYKMIDHPSGFPLVAGLLAGAILVASDPGALLPAIRRLRQGPSLAAVLEGESLFSDAAAIVMFSIILQALLLMRQDLSIIEVLATFFLTLTGGLAVGFVIGRVLCFSAPYIDDLALRTLLNLASAYGLYVACEYWLGLSGILAVLVCGLVLSGDEQIVRDEHSVGLKLVARAAEIGIFIVAGATFTSGMVREQWFAMLSGVVAALSARILIVGFSAALHNFVSDAARRFDLQGTAVLIGGGLRGVVAIALALSLPLDLQSWYTIQAIVYGVVVFSLLINLPAVAYWLRRIA